MNDNIAAAEMEADLNQARRTAVMAHNVVIRLRELGLPEALDAELASVSTDLGDLWGAQKEFTDHLHDMLKTAHDWDSVGDSFVDMRASIEHIAWHLESIREPLTKLAEYAYSPGTRPSGRQPAAPWRTLLRCRAGCNPRPCIHKNDQVRRANSEQAH